MLFLLLCVSLLLQVPASNQLEIIPEASSPTLPVGSVPLPSGAPMLRLNGQTWDVLQLESLARLRPMRGVTFEPARSLRWLTPGGAERLGRHLGAVDLVAEKAKKDGVGLSAEEESLCENVGIQFLAGMLEERVTSGIDSQKPPREELELIYDREREQFRVHEEFRVRTIFASAYRQRRVREGETLESIARTAECEAAAILDSDSKKSRLSMPTPVVKNELLLLPGGPAEFDAAKRKIDRALERIANGEDFSKVASELSESTWKGRPVQLKPDKEPVSQSLLRAVASLADGEVSAPIRNKHGYQIVKREKHVEAAVRPFEVVEGQLVSLWKRDKKEQAIRNFLAGELGARYRDGAERPWPGLEIPLHLLRAPDGNLRLERSQAIQAVSSSAEMRPEVLRWAVAGHVEIGSDRVRQLVDGARNTIIAEKYLRSYVKSRLPKFSDEELDAFARESTHLLIKKDSWELQGVVLAGDPDLPDEQRELDAMKRLARHISGVHSLEEFTSKATQLNDPFDARLLGGGFMGRVEEAELGPLRAVALREAKPGLVGPVYEGGEAWAYWLKRFIPGRKLVLPEDREEIAEEMRKERGAPMIEELLRGLGESVKVEVVFQEAGGSPP